MLKEIIVPKGDEVLYDDWHFSPAIKVNDVVYVAGQVGVDAELTPGAGMAAQAVLLFENLKRVLEAAGAVMSDIVDITSFHMDLHGEDLAAFQTVKDRYIPNNYPAWSAFGVTQLALPELLVEVKVTAIIGCGA